MANTAPFGGAAERCGDAVKKQQLLNPGSCCFQLHGREKNKCDTEAGTADEEKTDEMKADEEKADEVRCQA